MLLSYLQKTFVPGDDYVPGNSTATNPLTFGLAPAEGPDIARIKSVLVAAAGLNADSWHAGQQDAVIHAFTTGAPAFVNTITKITGLSIPAAMALRVGLPVPDGQDTVAIVNGYQFSRIVGFTEMLVLSMALAAEILKLSGSSHVDPRLFAQPSGLQPLGTATPAKGTNATSAPAPPEGSATAAGPTRRRASRRPGTSRPN
jgi:hypothetical protein